MSSFQWFYPSAFRIASGILDERLHDFGSDREFELIHHIAERLSA